VSTDVYIPIKYVVSHPELFALSCAFIGGTEHARDELAQDNPDYGYVAMIYRPTMYCRFDGYRGHRECAVSEAGELHLPIGGSFRTWLLTWLEQYDVPFVHIVD
jgi:hypothetical protein